MPLHPQSQALLAQVHRAGIAPFHTLPIAQMRHDAQKLHFAFRPAAPDLAEAHAIEIPRPDGSVMPARYYRGAGTEPEALLPLLVYFHGGGWSVGDLASYDVLCRELANGAGCAVVSVGYRLAPEHPFPAAHEDTLTALCWLAAHAGALRLDGGRIAVGGDSAGGNLAAVAALACRDAGVLRICFQLLVYPMVDQRCLTDSHQRFAHGHMLTAEVIARFQSFYLPRASDRLDWRASPMLAASHRDLPPALLISAECDPLVDEVAAYAHALSAAGVAAQLQCFPGMIHGFFTLGKLFPDGMRAVKIAAAALASNFRLA